ncbi:ATP synthase mitochondrial F1 complex assembly factor 1-like [Paramacrobiotus metropolitanus]|uniref:ATP synthase mitochondrial F1 complex assembly factor 1-like n=1 Tax=Paramacrobiotus metropolitanus TaxID=2943436 RepID=UPI002445F769|nr:ATP synthase mitochondrial F1 complex assembly factor 1-like [Paramacrobiotus metropolitanus]
MSHGLRSALTRLDAILIRCRRIPAALYSSKSPEKREKMEELQSSPYYTKYASKLTELQKANPAEFAKRLEEHKSVKQAVKEADKERVAHPVNIVSTVDPHKPAAAVRLQRTRLADLMKVELLTEKTAEEIAEMWRVYHKDKPGFICASMPASSYAQIQSRAATHPTFLYPLPRAAGYEFFVSQFAGAECHFTQLAAFQQRKADAPTCLSLVHLDELRDSKGLVLMRGQYDQNVVNAVQVQCLLNQLQLYYATSDPHKLHLLQQFNAHPDAFDYRDLISEVEHSFIGLT